MRRRRTHFSSTPGLIRNIAMAEIQPHHINSRLKQRIKHTGRICRWPKSGKNPGTALAFRHKESLFHRSSQNNTGCFFQNVIYFQDGRTSHVAADRQPSFRPHQTTRQHIARQAQGFPSSTPRMHPSAPPPGTLHTPITPHQQRPTYPTNTLQHRTAATHISKHSNTA